MNTDSSMLLNEAVERARMGEDLQILCPSHEDGTPSLHVSPGSSGQAVALRCFAGCEVKDILDAVNLTWADVCAEREDDTVAGADVWTPNGTASHVYPYHDAQGTLLYEVLRVQQGSKKVFSQRSPSADGKWNWRTSHIDKVLYRLPEVLEGVDQGRTIHITEGEKDADSLRRKGLVATCNAGGAGIGKWLPSYTEVLAGANVIIHSDADDAGRPHSRAIRAALVEAGAVVEIREPSPGHKDVTEMLQAGIQLDKELVVVPARESERMKFGIDVLDIIQRKVTDTEFVIPGTLARRERLIVTGLEGHGKSTLLRQIAGCVAAGIHPFTLADCEPKRVLQIEAENDPNQTVADWQSLLELLSYHNKSIDRDQMIVLEEWDNSDLDLSSADGTAWLHERIHAYQPDLVVMGPLTNMVGRDLKDDEPVRKLKSCVNSARAICGSAFIMEHHAPHKAGNDKNRSIRPYGSSMFLRWPDFGFGMKPMEDEAAGTYKWDKFRWPRVRTRAWPEALRWGDKERGELPWVETMLTHDQI